MDGMWDHRKYVHEPRVGLCLLHGKFDLVQDLFEELFFKPVLFDLLQSLEDDLFDLVEVRFVHTLNAQS